VQSSPQAVEWQSARLSGQDAVAARASKKLRSDESLVTGFAATRLRMELDRVPLWRGDHVVVKQLVEDFARYLYLPRLKEPPVLLEAIRDGLRLLTWSQDSFAYTPPDFPTQWTCQSRVRPEAPERGIDAAPPASTPAQDALAAVHLQGRLVQ
jgi:hypothetical protein